MIYICILLPQVANNHSPTEPYDPHFKTGHRSAVWDVALNHHAKAAVETIEGIQGLTKDASQRFEKAKVKLKP